MPEYTYINDMRFHQTALGLLPGVTTVLSNTKDERSQAALDRWRDRVGSDEADRIRDEAAVRGTKLHKAIEDYLIKQPQTLEPETQILFNLIKPGLEDVEIIKAIEQDTYHPLGYAGTPDLVASYKGNLTVFDWKTSSKPKKRAYIQDYILQVCAYIQSFNWFHNLNIDRGLVVVVSKDSDAPQLFKITPKQYQKGRVEFNRRLLEFQSIFTDVVF